MRLEIEIGRCSNFIVRGKPKGGGRNIGKEDDICKIELFPLKIEWQ